MNSETLRAVVDCLIPADDFPGAYDAGVCDYLERLLQTDLAEHAEFFRAGIDAIDVEALARFDKPFAQLSQDEQNATLVAIESRAPRFFEMLVNTTIEGYYSEPQQGGNRGAISWLMTGFEELSDS
jgi:gluconate 2-dehydrogenase subunit 3-like protein